MNIYKPFTTDILHFHAFFLHFITSSLYMSFYIFFFWIPSVYFLSGVYKLTLNIKHSLWVIYFHLLFLSHLQCFFVHYNYFMLSIKTLISFSNKIPISYFSSVIIVRIVIWKYMTAEFIFLPFFFFFFSFLLFWVILSFAYLPNIDLFLQIQNWELHN